MTNRAEFERLLDVYGFRCERFGQDLSTHARAQVVSAFAALASAPVAGEAQPVAWLHQCRKKPELATVTMNKREPALAAKGYRPIPLYAAPQASEAVRGEPDATGRTPTDYALEFAEYLARDVEYAVACLNSSQRANEALLDLTEEVATAGAYQAAEDAAAQADEAFTEAITALQSAVFEFRKRRDRAALSAQPSGNPGELGAQRATVRNPLTVQSSGNSGELSAQPGAQKYWLCCGSRDPNHPNRRAPDCFNAAKAKWGTADQHSAAQKNGGSDGR